MSNKVAIIGQGPMSANEAPALKALEIIPNEAPIVTPEKELTDLSKLFFKNEYVEQSMEIIKESSIMVSAIRGKEKRFKCKGKHQYREVRTQEGNIIKAEWICECGRKIGD